MAFQDGNAFDNINRNNNRKSNSTPSKVTISFSNHIKDFRYYRRSNLNQEFIISKLMRTWFYIESIHCKEPLSWVSNTAKNDKLWYWLRASTVMGCSLYAKKRAFFLHASGRQFYSYAIKNLINFVLCIRQVFYSLLLCIVCVLRILIISKIINFRFFCSNNQNIQLAAISLCNSLFMKTHQESTKVWPNRCFD